jgi:type IV secretion system protein VirB1
MREGRSFDMGFAQINSQHLKPNGFLSKLGITVDDIFEPCVNLRAGANIYGNAAIKNGGDVKVALSIYNTGTKSNGISNGYVQKVLGSNL